MEKVYFSPNYLFKFDCEKELIFETLNEVKALKFESNTFNEASASRHLHREKCFSSLTCWINQCLSEVNSSLDYAFERLEVSLMWANRGEPGSLHSPHTHSNSFASGILYLEPADTPTYFMSTDLWYPEKPFFTTKGTSRTWLEYEHKGLAGELIIFPSTLFHRVEPNLSKCTRYTLSFNAFPYGILGSEASATYLNLTDGHK